MEPHLIEGDHGYGVVGSQYVGEPENVIEPGDYVFTLKLEPLDAYDSNAVPVYLGSVKMGFFRAPSLSSSRQYLTRWRPQETWPSPMLEKCKSRAVAGLRSSCCPESRQVLLERRWWITWQSASASGSERRRSQLQRMG